MKYWLVWLLLLRLLRLSRKQDAISSLPVLHEHLNDTEALSKHGMIREPAGALN